MSETIDQMRAASELVAQRVMERVLDLVVQSLDVNELASQVDVDALLKQVDLNAVIEKIDLNALLSRVDVQALAERIDVGAVLHQTDIGAVIAMSSGHVSHDAVDVLRGQAVAMDDRIDRLVRRLLRRGDPSLAAQAALVNGEAGA